MSVHRTRACSSDGGQVLPVLALLLVLMAVGAVGAVRLAAELAAMGRAGAAADATALAGATGGAAAARSVAAANGATLVSFTAGVDDTRVEVRVGRFVARARARAEGPPGRTSPGPSDAAGEVAGLVPALRLALARAAVVLGRPVPVTSGYRSPADQARLWARRSESPYPVAAPGRSAHQAGRAVDVPLAVAEVLAAHERETGLCRPLPRTDPVHFELCSP